MEIGDTHLVIVDNTQTADTCTGQIDADGRTESTCTDHKHTGLTDKLLPCFAHLGEKQLTGITFGHRTNFLRGGIIKCR